MSIGKQEAESAPTSIDPNQSPYLKRLYQGGEQALPGAQQYDQYMGQVGRNNLTRAFHPDDANFRQGAQTLRQISGNRGVNPQLQAYQQNVQRNFDNNIMPSIQGSAGQANAIGGSRRGVAQGVAAGMANQDITNMAANLYGQDQDRALRASQQLQQSSFNRSAQGYNALQTMAGMNVGQRPYMNQGAILGNPTLTGGGSSSKGKNIGL